MKRGYRAERGFAKMARNGAVTAGPLHRASDDQKDAERGWTRDSVKNFRICRRVGSAISGQGRTVSAHVIRTARKTVPGWLLPIGGGQGGSGTGSWAGAGDWFFSIGVLSLFPGHGGLGHKTVRPGLAYRPGWGRSRTGQLSAMVQVRARKATWRGSTWGTGNQAW